MREVIGQENLMHLVQRRSIAGVRLRVCPASQEEYSPVLWMVSASPLRSGVGSLPHSQLGRQRLACLSPRRGVAYEATLQRRFLLACFSVCISFCISFRIMPITQFR